MVERRSFLPSPTRHREVTGVLARLGRSADLKRRKIYASPITLVLVPALPDPPRMCTCPSFYARD